MATINGTSSDDILSARSNDTISGLAGNDTLTGSGGQDTFVVRAGEGTDTITDFGGVGTGVRPTSSVIAEVDTLQFEGSGLNAEYMLLNQDGSDLRITFEDVEDTQVILKDFNLEDLDNLQKSTGASVDIGNILFDGQTEIQDSFDVFNANQNRASVFNKNTVTFLNDLDNNTRGKNGSNDVIKGQGGNEELRGLSGDDILDGGSGIDSLYGGSGNDTYIVNSTTDTIIEYANGGETDTVQSSVSYTLGNYLNNLTLTGVNDINGTGNKLNNTIYGNSGANILDGRADNDTLYGRDGDTLYGGTGNDLLEAFSYFAGDSFDGGDTSLYGGDGNDTLGGSLAVMYGGDGNDDLSAFLGGIYGDDGDDVLRGSGSSLYGGNGNDTLTAGVYSNVAGFGSSTAYGGNGNDVLTGYGSSLYGGNGNDTLTGYSYTFFDLDYVMGETNYSQYLFNAPTEGVDTIVQFALNGDQIVVSASGFGGGLTSGDAITPTQFVIGSAARDTSDRFIYNQNTGALSFDIDGTGGIGQLQFATLSPGLAMTNADIFVN